MLLAHRHGPSTGTQHVFLCVSPPFIPFCTSSCYIPLTTTRPGAVVCDVRTNWAKALLRQADFSVARFSVL